MNARKKAHGDNIPPALAIYAIHNLIIRAAKVAIIIAAIWTALKPGGSVAAAIVMALIGGIIKPLDYGQNHDRDG